MCVSGRLIIHGWVNMNNGPVGATAFTPLGVCVCVRVRVLMVGYYSNLEMKIPRLPQIAVPVCKCEECVFVHI